MAINWETVLVALTTGLGAAALTHVIGPFTAYALNKRTTRDAWRRESINQVRDQIPRFLGQPEIFDSLIESDAYTRLLPHLNPDVVKVIDRDFRISVENELLRPTWTRLLLKELDHLESKWGL